MCNKTWLQFRKAVCLTLLVLYQCQEYNCSMKSILHRPYKPFDFCSKDTRITFLLIYFGGGGGGGGGD